MKRQMTKTTCAWVPGENELYKTYHDEEWGVPLFDDKKIFEFLVPTVIYAHMQATGMVNDHTIDCFRHRQVKKVRIPTTTQK